MTESMDVYEDAQAFEPDCVKLQVPVADISEWTHLSTIFRKFGLIDCIWRRILMSSLNKSEE